MAKKELADMAGARTAYRPQYQQIAERLVELIAASSLKVGDRLPTEQKLGEQLGVSRSVVREAVKYLTATGLIGVRKGFGIYVADQENAEARPSLNPLIMVEPEQVQALLEFRRIQEETTARLAVTRITVAELHHLERQIEANRRAAEAGHWDEFIESDNLFHQGIARATHNPFFADTIDNVIHAQRWIIKMILGGYPGSMSESAIQHMAIFRAVQQGDGEAAAAAMKEHIEAVLFSYQRTLKQRLMSDREEPESRS